MMMYSLHRPYTQVYVPFHHHFLLRALFVVQVSALVSHSLYTRYNAWFHMARCLVKSRCYSCRSLVSPKDVSLSQRLLLAADAFNEAT